MDYYYITLQGLLLYYSTGNVFILLNSEYLSLINFLQSPMYLTSMFITVLGN